MAQNLTLTLTQGQRFEILLRQPTPRQLESIVPFYPVRVEIPGPQGVPGPQGPQGIQGPQGSGAGSYRHVQTAPLSIWTILHDLGYRPGGVMVFDSGGNQWHGTVTHVDQNSLTIDFHGNIFGGEAYLS